MADELVVMCSGAFFGLLETLLVGFQDLTGLSVRATSGASFGTTMRAIPVRLRSGQEADVVILLDDTVDELIDAGLIARGTKTRLASSGIGVAVRSGTPHPDISSIQGLRNALHEARSFAYSASASGIYVASHLLRRLNLPTDVDRKGFRVVGEPVGAAVARGDAALGFQQMSELIPIDGIDVIGALPTEVQHRSILSAAIPSMAKNGDSARALIDYLASEQVRAASAGYGLSPYVVS